MTQQNTEEIANALREVHIKPGKNLYELTEAAPVLLIFLRQFG